jgi:hypothetical protein
MLVEPRVSCPISSWQNEALQHEAGPPAGHDAYHRIPKEPLENLTEQR